MVVNLLRQSPSLWAGASLFSSNINISQRTTKMKSRFYTSLKSKHFYKQRISCNNVSSSTSATDSKKDIPQPSSLWADEDHSISSEDDTRAEEEYVKEIKMLKETVRNTMKSTKNYNPKDKLILIDTLERMGVAHHFEEQIEEQLQHIIMFYAEYNKCEDHDLFTTALYFRLLRQHGYDVSSSVFDKFTDKEDNKFKKILSIDTEGLMSLYEASYVRYREEIILQEARDYARYYLNEARPYLRSHLKEKVTRALKQPLHWALPKVEARHYMSIYEANDSKDEGILRLAKLDFHLMQKLYMKELNDVREWLNSYDNLLSKLPYARNNAGECYFWAVGICHEPQYSHSRIAITKTIILCTLLNDTYDSYATLEELELFTEIIQSWDAKEIGKLPEYMKTLYEALLHAFTEFESEVSGQERSYVVDYLKETVKELAWLYFAKANWYKAKTHIPTFQEHIDTGAALSALRQTLAAYYMHLESAPKESFDWLMSMPRIVEEAGLYCRYLNDITSYEREHESGQFPTAIDCYMEENGLSKQETMDKFAEFAEVSWMTLNKEWTAITCVEKDTVKPIINFARLMYAIYGEGLDGFTSLQGKLYTLIDALFGPVAI